MMPGKLLSDVNLESDTAMGKVEIPRKEKVPLRAEGAGARQDQKLGRWEEQGSGVPERRGAPAGSAWGAALTRLVQRPAWVSAKGCPAVVFSVGYERVGAPRELGQIGTGGRARRPTWYSSLGPQDRVCRVGRPRLRPTFWLKLRPNSWRVSARREL